MLSLKKIMIANFRRMSAVMIILILAVAMLLQVQILQQQELKKAEAAFLQVEQVLKENTAELEAIEEEYRETCLLNAEAIAYMIQHHPEILGDIEEFRRIAQMIQVDEIHIFDKTGTIFTGTHPEYFDFSFSMGGQIGFFAPMLEDKTLRLCQEITPNTAEGKLVQYSAVWSADEEFIVEVGMYPETVMEYTEKNELSYIFTLLRGNPGVDLYAVDAETGEIRGSTVGGDDGKHVKQIGLELEEIKGYENGAHATVRGTDSYCIFKDMEGTLIGYVASKDMMYQSVSTYMLMLATAIILIAVGVIVMLWHFTQRYVIGSIHDTNEKLRAVAEGNLDERIHVHSSLEFFELSSYINEMIQSLLSSTDKMSFVLNHTNMDIGVYEYNTNMKTVRFTEHIPEILGWSNGEQKQYAADHNLLQEYLKKLRNTPVEGEKNIYCLAGEKETYIKSDEITNGADTLGIIIDVTEDFLLRRRIERERDIDLLTGLYNRRGLERELQTAFAEESGCGALIMIDADGLKTVNDIYGHTVGDRYLQVLAERISAIGAARHFAGRMGGDEFVLLLYGYQKEEDVFHDLEEVRYIQKNTKMLLETGIELPVRFSFGYVLTEGRTDIQAMVSEADRYMYDVKRLRKQAEQRKRKE